MAYPIKFLLLQKSELMYEVAIRGEAPSDNVGGLRRQVTKLTQLYPSDEILDSVLEYADDVNGIQETMDKVRANLESLRATFNESLYNRTKSLLHHLHFRLLRVQTPTKSDESKLFSTLKTTFESYYSYFLGLTTTTTTSTGESNLAPNEESQDKINFSGLNIAVTCERSVMQDLAKLKYDGKSCVRSFVQKLEEFRISKGLTEAKMLSSASDIFSGDALHWYRSIRGSIVDWNGLVSALKEDFDIPDYEYRMASEIQQRTQGEGESITIYLAIMNGMFSRLTKQLSEEEKLEIILHNIRPSYSTIIAASPNIRSIQELGHICKNYERIKVRSDNFREPPPVSASTLAPEFSYQPEKRKEFSKTFFNDKSKTNFRPPQFRKPYPSNSLECDAAEPVNEVKLYCHRCRVTTHSMKECPAERTIFCFKCGKKDVRSPDCPDCSQSKVSNEKKN